MTSWIFQANPDQFDVDGYLATGPSEILWLAKQHAADMKLGEQVFIWRAIGNGDPKLSGIVAEARIVSLPALQPDVAESLPYWFGSGATPELRVKLELLRIELKDRFKRSWFDNDPIMSNSAIIKVRTGTNFKLAEAESDRLNALWRRAKVDWTYAEALAGLWAYWRTMGGSVSKLPSAPVVEAALRTGRVVGGVYNKVMNFRALDPSDPRKGLSASSIMDGVVWRKFYDPLAGQLKGSEIEEEYARLWPSAPTLILPAQASVEATAEPLTKLPLEELLARFAKRAAKGKSRKPRTYRTTTNVFERSELVVAIARVRAGDKCEVPNCSHLLFSTTTGDNFIEVHHIEPLAEGGSDEPSNVACVCPSHHREAHHGSDATAIRIALQAKRAEKNSVAAE